MPDPVTHYVFAGQVVSGLSDEVRRYINPPISNRAAQGPDPWSVIGFYGGKNKQYSSRSNTMHKSNTGLYLRTLAENVRKNRSSDGFSLLVGAVCHYCLDKAAHPYIICKGGNYDGTEQTRNQSGGHVRVERAIDSHYITNVFGKEPWHFSIPLNIMKLKRYPESLRDILNDTYMDVYGWEDVFELINKSLRDEMWFYGLMQDPLGIAYKLLRPVSGGKTNYCIYSFYHRKLDTGNIDYLNLKHNPWCHPYDPSIVSTASFFDLFDKAKLEAVEIISKAYEWIFNDADLQTESLFPDYNYSTGFLCDDPRNQNKPVYEPLNK